MLVKFDQRDLNCHHRRLNDNRLIDLGLGVLSTQFHQQRPSGEPLKQDVDRLHPFAKDRFALHQLQAHARPLATLTRKNECQLRPSSAMDRRRERRGIDLTVSKFAKLVRQVLRRLTNDRQHL
ncbi:MAG: hypothetical protein FD138_4766 [Planctomycetota bacterium]|nr:MAG: hypothetical protein FD138_4766 [Planctomycetota bacterium]